MAAKDLYTILGVARDAEPDQIKRAYRKLARKLHPDVNPGNKAAEERFKEISGAFDVLGDPAKRTLYDEFGAEGLQPGFEPEKARAYRSWRERASATGAYRAQAAGAADPIGSGAFDLNDLFGDLGDLGAGPAGPRRGADVRAEMSIPLRDAVLGTEREIAFGRPVACRACGGSGSAPTGGPAGCAECGGSGRRVVAQGPMTFHVSCAACGGTGRRPGPPCTRCGGAGQVERPTRLKVKVPAGIDDGQTIRLAGQGMPGRDGGSAGDLLVDVHVTPHPVLTRRGRDLYLDVPITVREAMLGGKIDLPTFAGTIKLTVPRGTQSGARLRVKGRGVPGGRGRAAGDLYVVVHVQVPAAADAADAARAAEELERHYGGDVRAGLRL